MVSSRVFNLPAQDVPSGVTALQTTKGGSTALLHVLLSES